MLRYTAIILACLIYTVIGIWAHEIEWSGWTDICSIDHIDDGDTFDIRCSDRWLLHDVRLLWVNTPDIRAFEDNCFYKESKNYIEKRIEKTYRVQFYGSDLCKDTSKGCRNLVTLYDIEGGFDVWEIMILKWFAFSWTNFSVIPDSIREKYDQNEAYAFEHWFWIWGKCEVEFFEDTRIDSPIPDKMTLPYLRR